MAEEKPNETNEQTQAPKKGLPIKTILVLAVVLLIEGVAISAAFLLAGGPAEVKADGAAIDEAAMLEMPTEVVVADGKFQNTRSGRSYLYDTEVWIVIKKKNRELVEQTLESSKAQIGTDISRIFRRAEPAYLIEPELSTLTRQVRAALDERIGHDGEGEAIILEVLIPECKRYRSDL